MKNLENATIGQIVKILTPDGIVDGKVVLLSSISGDQGSGVIVVTFNHENSGFSNIENKFSTKNGNMYRAGFLKSRGYKIVA